MLTVKHIGTDSGRETIMEADRVERAGGGAVSLIIDGESVCLSIDAGTYYVMNRFGATVATYKDYGLESAVCVKSPNPEDQERAQAVYDAARFNQAA